MAKRLSIIVVEKDRDRAIMFVYGRREAGDYDVRVIADELGLARRISERNPDPILIDAGDRRTHSESDLGSRFIV